MGIDYPSFWVRLVFIVLVLISIARRKPGYLIPMQVWSCLQIMVNLADTIDFSMLYTRGKGNKILSSLSENWFPVVDGSQLYFYNIGYYTASIADEIDIVTVTSPIPDDLIDLEQSISDIQNSSLSDRAILGLDDSQAVPTPVFIETVLYRIIHSLCLAYSVYLLENFR